MMADPAIGNIIPPDNSLKIRADFLKKVVIFMILLLWNFCHHLTNQNNGGFMNITIQASSVSPLASSKILEDQYSRMFIPG
jgi:hypothetical protein